VLELLVLVLLEFSGARGSGSGSARVFWCSNFWFWFLGRLSFLVLEVVLVLVLVSLEFSGARGSGSGSGFRSLCRLAQLRGLRISSLF
jgi:hypothetical protein